MHGPLKDDDQPERLTTDLSQMHNRGLQARKHPPQIMDQLSQSLFLTPVVPIETVQHTTQEPRTSSDEIV